MPGHYLALTPDINAARIEGPGESSLILGGAAMTGLGTAVAAAAATVSASVSTLAAAGWTGASGVSTAASFAPNVAWMSTHAAKLAAIGTKHVAFAQAYRTANLMIPKVPLVAENQFEHITLQATNFMGINGIPIAANRGVYQGYWTAAGTAMNTYEAIGAMESVPIPAEPPPPITTMGIGMLSSAISTGVSLGVGAAQGAMNAATSGIGAATTGAGTAAALGPAATGLAGTNSGSTGANGQPATTGTAGKAGASQQLTSLLPQASQAASQIPQVLGAAPQAVTEAVSGPGQAVMGPLQGLLTGGSGLGAPPTGAGMSGMYPGSGLANATGSGARSASKSAGLTRPAVWVAAAAGALRCPADGGVVLTLWASAPPRPLRWAVYVRWPVERTSAAVRSAAGWGR